MEWRTKKAGEQRAYIERRQFVLHEGQVGRDVSQFGARAVLVQIAIVLTHHQSQQ